MQRQEQQLSDEALDLLEKRLDERGACGMAVGDGWVMLAEIRRLRDYHERTAYDAFDFLEARLNEASVETRA